jgi:uncharacterized membrane protein
MAQLITLIAFLLGFPFLVMWAEKRTRVVRWISPIIICYLVGILVGNIPGLMLNRDVQETASMISVVLAIPLLLFSANLQVLLKQVRPALFSFFLGIAGVLLVASLAFLLFRDRISDAHAASGMMVGCYTGGTQNMSAIGMGLDVDEEVFVLLNSADIVFSGIYFIFLLTAAHKILGGVLPSYRQKLKVEEIPTDDQPEAVQPGNVVHVLAGLALALVVVGISAGSSLLVLGKLSEPVVILLITTLGIGASFIPKVRALPSTFSTANYMLLVFALAVGSMANFKELLDASSALFWFCGFVVFGSILVHYLLAILFRVDRDTLIITSTAAIFGPAFIGPVAGAIGNKDIITIGIALGLIGYAIGNYLGLGLAYMLNGAI